MASHKKEFTPQDMKKAFLAGGYAGSEASQWGWERWMRNAYPKRYIRKKATKAKAATAGGR